MNVRFGKSLIVACLAVNMMAVLPTMSAQKSSGEFHIEEASITDIQSAIRSGQTSCKQVVQAYIARAKAYNGV